MSLFVAKSKFFVVIFVVICRDLSRFEFFRKLASVWKGGSDGSGLARLRGRARAVRIFIWYPAGPKRLRCRGYVRPDRRDAMYPYTTKHRETSCCTARIGLPCMDMSVAMLPFMSMKNSHPAALFLASR